MSTDTEVVADPVSHISISGVHDRDELNERLADAPTQYEVRRSPIGFLLVGAAIGATLAYLLKRE